MKQKENESPLLSRIKVTLAVLGAGVLVNFGLALMKLFVGLQSNSLCILLDSTNSFFDILTGIVTILAFLMLLSKKKDKDSLGYGRSEYVAGFIVSVVSVVVGGTFLLESVNRMAMPEPVWFGLQSCIMISVAFVVKLGMAIGYYYANKKIKSKALAALVLDSFLDLGITGASLISFAISSNVDYAVDAIFGILISVVIIVCGLKMVFDNLKILVSNNVNGEDALNVKNVCEAQSGVESVGRILLHDYGYARSVGTVEVKFSDGTGLDTAIEISEEISGKLKRDYNVTVEVVPVASVENADAGEPEDDEKRG